MRLRPRPAFALWLLLVLLAHALAWTQWRAELGADAALAPIQPLKVVLSKPMALQAPPLGPSTPQLRTRRLEAPTPLERRPVPPEPLDVPQAEPSPALDPLPPQAPALASTGHGVDAPAGVEWPLSVRLRYQLVGHFRGPVHGEAEVQWLRQDDRYQVRLKVQVGPSLAPVVRRELTSDGRITPEGTYPERYDEETKLLLSAPRRVSLLRQGGQLRLADGRWRAAPEGLQDSASQFVQLAFLFLSGRAQLESGAVIELPLALPYALHDWRYEVGASERMESPMGGVDAWHLRPLNAATPGALMAEVWLVPSMQYLPLQMLIRQGSENWVRLSLAEAPLQEDPAPQNAASAPPSSPASEPPP